MIGITPIPAFDDNYIWMIGNPDAGVFVAVDPGDETPVLEWLRQRQGLLSAILITHHHYDHTGGVPELLTAFPGIPVYGPARERIRGLNRPVAEGQLIRLAGLDLSLRVLETPGHTAGHVSYLGAGTLFCGDTLFAAGCGRVFDGSFDQLAGSLQRIAGLPGETGIYCAHEYTLANLGFAAWVEPGSRAIARRTETEKAKRLAAVPTLPSRLSVELETNPFLRTDVPGVIAAAQRYAGRPLREQREIFAALRRWKDREYD